MLLLSFEASQSVMLGSPCLQLWSQMYFECVDMLAVSYKKVKKNETHNKGHDMC